MVLLPLAPEHPEAPAALPLIVETPHGRRRAAIRAGIVVVRRPRPHATLSGPPLLELRAHAVEVAARARLPVAGA